MFFLPPPVAAVLAAAGALRPVPRPPQLLWRIRVGLARAQVPGRRPRDARPAPDLAVRVPVHPLDVRHMTFRHLSPPALAALLRFATAPVRGNATRVPLLPFAKHPRRAFDYTNRRREAHPPPRPLFGEHECPPPTD